jgi:hypothetical protein
MSEDTRGEMLIRREEAKLERAKAKLEAYEKTMTDTIASLLKQERNKKALARDAMEATRNPGRRDEMLDKADGGIYNDDGEIVTGKEPRPWEN